MTVGSYNWFELVCDRKKNQGDFFDSIQWFFFKIHTIWDHYKSECHAKKGNTWIKNTSFKQHSLFSEKHPFWEKFQTKVKYFSTILLIIKKEEKSYRTSTLYLFNFSQKIRINEIAKFLYARVSEKSIIDTTVKFHMVIRHDLTKAW